MKKIIILLIILDILLNIVVILKLNEKKDIGYHKIADCPRIAIENPIGIMSSKYRKPDQIIQPWMFGDKYTKSTCLWLKGLPKLKPTNIVEHGEYFEWIDKNGKKKRQPKWFFEALKKAKTPEERSILRSKTFPGIALAMATQWTIEESESKGE